jgi:metal-responsive CopG/Arc/MetJ family transcriptional regulator
MSDEKDPRIITPMPHSMVTAIDDFRFGNRLPSRADAIRRLIELGLEAAKAQEEQEKAS